MVYRELRDTIPDMMSDDYRKRFIVEYQQTKIRYEKLKAYCNKIEASNVVSTVEPPAHDIPLEMLREQQRIMGSYLHIL